MWTAQAIVVCALGLLGRSEQSFPPIQLAETAPIGASRFVAAYVTQDEHPHIVLITSTAAFVEARHSRSECGPLDAIREIAGVLAHEEWHLRHGPDEERAYDDQLTMLLFIGVHPDSALYHKVMKAKQAVVAAERRASQATVVARGTSPSVDALSAPGRDGR